MVSLLGVDDGVDLLLNVVGDVSRGWMLGSVGAGVDCGACVCVCCALCFRFLWWLCLRAVLWTVLWAAVCCSVLQSASVCEADVVVVVRSSVARGGRLTGEFLGRRTWVLLWLVVAIAYRVVLGGVSVGVGAFAQPAVRGAIDQLAGRGRVGADVGAVSRLAVRRRIGVGVGAVCRQEVLMEIAAVVEAGGVVVRLGRLRCSCLRRMSCVAGLC